VRAGSGNATGFALTSDRRLLGWGAVSGREGSLDPDPLPYPIPSLPSVTGFSAGGAHACAIANGQVFCWGLNRSSRLCTGLPDDARLPTLTSTKGTAYPQRVAVSEQATCVRMTDGAIQCCGDNHYGQLGSGNAGSQVSVFERATAFERRAVQVVTSEVSTCALVDDGSVECWGGNAHSELGQGTRDDAPHPTPVRITF
ncbi:MAG: repeat domain protein, partial [Labilithrix sp.]|nr:repeat domain protein [Labilithrix sp.]